MKRKAVFRRVTILLLLVCISIYFVFSHAVPVVKLDQVAKGMTEAQVTDLLGPPQHVRHDPPATTVFYYGGFQRLQFCTVEVSFGPDGREIGVFHDH